jgi:hypothetical protein
MDQTQAKTIADRLLGRSEPARRKAQFSVPLAEGFALGAVVKFPDNNDLWKVENLSLGTQADVTVTALPHTSSTPQIAGLIPALAAAPNWVSQPVALAFDLPGRVGAQVGVLQTPFRASEVSFGGQSAALTRPLKIGALLTPLAFQPPTLWDRQSEIDIYMPDGTWFAISELEALNGGNHFAVETAEGWEIIGAAVVALVGEGTYRLKTLLRGLSNSDDNMIDVIPAGARVVALDAGLVDLPIDVDFVGQTLDIAVSSGGRSGVSGQLAYEAAHLRPLSVAHISAEAVGAETQISWFLRNLDNADDVDASAQVDVEWPDGAILVTGTSALIPVEMGANIPVTLTPIHPIGGSGKAKTIWV